MWHDDAERQVLAESFRGWLEQFANDLEAGRYALSEEYDGLVSIDDI
jgi:cell wall assembly regulator SMI1